MSLEILGGYDLTFVRRNEMCGQKSWNETVHLGEGRVAKSYNSPFIGIKGSQRQKLHHYVRPDLSVFYIAQIFSKPS